MVSVNAGGGVLFRHDLWHGAAMNSSTRRRHLAQVRYVESRDQRHQLRPCTAAVWAESTPQQRKLLMLRDPQRVEG
jgi:ectoine hydroxylase-related dioxygenase (phytanoyl-CoA dioxygenase family)